MTAAYRIIPNPRYTTYFFPNMATSNILYILTKLHYIHTYTPIYKFKVYPYKILLITALVHVKRILICSNVRSACTWKIVFKTQNNELNELSECMLYKMFCFFGKHLKTVKLSFTGYFPEAVLAYFKVSETFYTCLSFKSL